ncbi:MAG: PD40 domain-containing protein, partial [Anaerolineales bacterium]|nr:PD40 domain-containing protein [Anaerolineales bacterium]
PTAETATSPSTTAADPTPQPTESPASINTPTTIELPAVDLAQSRILYLGQAPGEETLQLLSMAADGSDVRLISPDLGREVNFLGVSPSGQSVAIETFDPTASVSILRTDDSTEPQPLLLESSTGWAEWSPNEDKIIFGDLYDLQLFDLTTGSETVIIFPLTTLDENERPIGSYEGAAWSPDGQWFVTQIAGTDANGQLKLGLYRYDLASDTVTTLYEESRFPFQINIQGLTDDSLPTLSPDGSQLLTDMVGQFELSLIPATGGEPVRIWRGRVPVLGGPHWSPDGRWLAFNYAGDIYLLRPDGSEWRNITNTPNLAEQYPAWSPDGQALVYAAKTVRDIFELERYDLATGETTRLTNDDGFSTELSAAAPYWYLPSEEQRNAIAQLPLLTPDPSEINIPPSPAPEQLIPPPPALMSPPWWRTRFTQRRPLTLTTDTPITVGNPQLQAPPIVQIPFDPDLLRDSLYYPEEGFDIQLGWWDAATQQWQEVPVAINAFANETTTLTFPLQADLPAGTTADQYYLYYGTLVRLQGWELARELDEFFAGWHRTPHESFPQEYLPFTVFAQLAGEEENIEATDVSIVNGPQNRPVTALNPNSNIIFEQLVSVGRGTISFALNPSSDSGRVLSVLVPTPTDLNSEEAILQGAPPPTFVPLMSYQSASFEITLGGQIFTFPAPLILNEWQQLTLSWSVGQSLDLYLDGQLVSTAPFDLTLSDNMEQDSVLSFNYFESGSNPIVLGGVEDVTGLMGNYMNVFMTPNYFTADQIDNHYRALWQVSGTLGDEQVALVTAEIGPDGGAIRTPDGRSWIYIEPNTFSALTTVSVHQFSDGETDASVLSRFAIHPQDLSELTSNLEGLFQIASLSTADDLALPNGSFTIYHQYDPSYVEQPRSINIAQFDPAYGWVTYREGLIDLEQQVTLQSDFTQWGTYVVYKSEGLISEQFR